MKKLFKYCPYCKSELSVINESGFERIFCKTCNEIFYDNPLIGTAVSVRSRDEILLIKRSIEPGLGKWAFPGGFVEQGESIEQAAIRELEEETGLKAKDASIAVIYNEHTKFYKTVIVPVVEVREYEGGIIAGEDVSESKFFSIKDAPELAFESHIKYFNNFIKKGTA